MAGSLLHIVDDDTGKFTMDTIENLGDAHEALEECFNIILKLSNGKIQIVNRVLRDLSYPKIEHPMIVDNIEGR